MSEALTHRHVDFLRDLMESKAREGLENGTIEIVEDLQTLGLVKHDLISGVGFRYWATPAGRILVATTDKHCAHGINIATLPWCLRNWKRGYRILVVEFTRENIASIPAHTDGKFRVHKCKVIREHEFDPVEIGLARADTEREGR